MITSSSTYYATAYSVSDSLVEVTAQVESEISVLAFLFYNSSFQKLMIGRPIRKVMCYGESRKFRDVT
jgi:hypothetical protein